jgi:hypothetical protein
MAAFAIDGMASFLLAMMVAMAPAMLGRPRSRP